MVPHLLLALLLSSAAVAEQGYLDEELDGCTDSYDSIYEEQCQKQSKVAKDAIRIMNRFINSPTPREPIAAFDNIEIVLNANDIQATFSNFRNFQDALLPIIRHEALLYSDYGEEKILYNYPFGLIKYRTTAWTYLGSPIKISVSLPFDERKVRKLTVELEKNHEDLLPHPEVPASGCTIRNASPEEHKQCEEQSRFWGRILHFLADIRITIGKLYGEDIGQISSCYEIPMGENMNCFNTTFQRSETAFKDSMLNYGLNRFIRGVPGVILENIPFKHTKGSFIVEKEKGSVLGKLSIFFNESSQVQYIYIGTEQPNWLPKRSSLFDCGDDGSLEMDCKKQVLTMNKIIDEINGQHEGKASTQYHKMFEDTVIVWKLNDRKEPTLIYFEEYARAIENFINTEGIEKFSLERNGHHYVNERDSVTIDWIGKTSTKDVVLKVTLGYDVLAAKKGKSGIKTLTLEFKQ